MVAIHEELIANGELVGTAGLAGPEAAKIVTHDGVGAPVVTDGPFPESKEFLAGYWLVDVESEQRAIEIAARTSAAPGPGGKRRATARSMCGVSSRSRFSTVVTDVTSPCRAARASPVAPGSPWPSALPDHARRPPRDAAVVTARSIAAAA